MLIGLPLPNCLFCNVLILNPHVSKICLSKRVVALEKQEDEKP